MNEKTRKESIYLEQEDVARNKIRCWCENWTTTDEC